MMIFFHMERFQDGLGADATSPNDFHLAIASAFLVLIAIGIIARCVYLASGMLANDKEPTEIFKTLKKRIYAAICALCVATILAAVERSFQ